MIAPIEEILQHGLSENRLLKLAKFWGVTLRGTSKKSQRLQPQIAAAYTSENILQRFKELPDTQQDLLNMLAVLSGSYRAGLPLQQAARKINERLNTKGIGEKTLRVLADTGLMFIVEQGWKSWAVVPDEVWTALVGNFAEQTARQIKLKSRLEEEVQVTVNVGLALYQDMLTLAAACVHEPVEVSQKGYIYKRTMNRILQSMRSQEEWFPQYFDSDLPRQFHFIYSFLEKESILTSNEYARVHANVMESLLAVDYMDWAQLLYNYYFQYSFIPDGTPVSFFNSVMFRLGREEWVSVESALQEITGILSVWRACPKREHIELICIRPYVALGLMKLAKDRKGELVFQWTAWGMEFILSNMNNVPDYTSQIKSLIVDDLFVQPNLEVIVPENALPAIRWKVEALAQLKQADSVLIYELSKERVIQALDAGWTLDSIRQFFDTYSKIPVADNVYQTIRGWIGNYGKAELWDVMVLRLDDADTAARLSQDKKLSKFIVGQFSTECLMILRKDEPKVRELLSGLGYPIAYHVRNPDLSPGSAGDRNRGRAYTTSRSVGKETVKSLTYNHNLKAIAPDYCNNALDKEEVLMNEFDGLNLDLLEPDEFDEEDDFDEEDIFDDEYDEFDYDRY